MLNIAEGFARRTDKEFRRYLSIATSSAAEVQSALYVALDQEYIDQAQFKRLYDLCSEIRRMIAGLQRYLRKSAEHGKSSPGKSDYRLQTSD